jgi:hypothetical protein
MHVQEEALLLPNRQFQNRSCRKKMKKKFFKSNTSIHKITVRNCIAWENGVCAEQQTQEE